MGWNFHICLRSGPSWLTPPPLTVSLTVKYPFFLTSLSGYVKILICKDEYNENRKKSQEARRTNQLQKSYSYSNADLSKISKFDIGVFWAPLEENLAMHSDGILWWIWDWIFPHTLHSVYIDTTFFARRNPISWSHFFHERYKRYTYPILFLLICMKELVKRNGCSDQNYKIDIWGAFLYVGGMNTMTNVQCWRVKKFELIKKTSANNVDGWTRC